MSSEIINKDLSSPLKHLFSLNFDRTSTLLDEVSGKDDALRILINKKSKRVTFSDPFEVSDKLETSKRCSVFNPEDLKGILRNKLSLEERDQATGIFNDEYIPGEDYSDDFSEEYASDSSERISDEQWNKPYEYVTSKDSLETEDSTSSEKPSSYALDNFVMGREAYYLVNSNIGNVDTSKSMNQENNSLQSCSSDKVNVSSPPSTLEVENKMSNSSGMVSNAPSSESKGFKNFIQHTVCAIKQKELANQNIVGSAVKCKKNVHAQFQPKKPKLHFCVISLPHGRNLENCKGAISVYKALSDDKSEKQPIIHGCEFSKSENSDHNHPLSRQTLQLNLHFKENEKANLSAKQLKSSVFHAWNNIKNVENVMFVENRDVQNLEGVSPKKTSKSNATSKGFTYWKQRKELSLKKKKQRSTKLSTQSKNLPLSSSNQSPKSSVEENAMVYKMWKQKKDEEQKQIQEKLEKEKKNEVNQMKAREVQNQEAASAFNVWKTIKEKAEKEQKQLSYFETEKQKQKQEEKEERERDAEEAYFLWLETKERSSSSKSKSILHIQPWSPPG